MGQYSATFRPVRDTSIQHQLYGASTAWEALDDISADDDSTYIFQPVNTTTTGQTVTTAIVLSGSIESAAPKIRIDSATLHIRTYHTSATSGVGGSGSVKTDVTYEIEGATGSGTASSSTTWTDRTISVDVSLFNNRIGAYEIPVTLATTGTRGTSGKSQDFEGRITQVYLEVTYDNYYDVTTIQCGTGSIQPSSVEVKEGDSYDSINIVGTDHKVVHVFDGETEVTDQCAHEQENVLHYVVPNVTTNREIKAIFDDYVEVFVKRNGVWLKGDKVFLKAGGAWSEQTPSIDTVISGVFEGKKLLIDGKLN